MTCSKTVPAVLAAIAVLTLPEPSSAQEAYEGGVQVTPRFNGDVAMRSAAEAAGPAASDRMAPMGVEIFNIAIGGGQTIERLAVPEDATLILQLRGGELLTVIDGERTDRAEGEFWTVLPGQSMVLVTDDDTAVISVTAIRGE